MSNEILDSLLKEYDRKKMKAENDLLLRKENLYNSIPRLQEIEDELLSINHLEDYTAKSILNGNKESLSELNIKANKLKKEKEQILQLHGLDLSYLKPNYECKICNDTGYYLNSENKSIMCNCLKQKLLDISFNNSNISNLNKENFEKFNPLMYSDEVDVAKYKFNISPRNNILKIKEKSIEFINNFDNENYKNLLFTGNAGLRKNIYV